VKPERTMDFWNDCLAALREKFTDQQFRIFLGGATLQIDGERLTLSVQSSAAANWVRRHPEIAQTIAQKARETLGMREPAVAVAGHAGAPDATGGVGQEEDRAAPILTTVPRQDAAPKRRDDGLSPNYSFENFIEGKANRLAMAAGASLADGAGIKSSNPLFIWGSVGLGKTHLAQAIGNRYREGNPSRKVRYIAANDFVGEVVKAFRNSRAEEFKERFHALDMLIIDDIQFIGGGATRTQEEFFFLFNFLVDRERPLIITCDRLPGQMDMHRRLTSRFQLGLMVSIDPPELELRVGILQRKAEEMGVELSDEIARYIAEKLKSNVRELEGALRRVVAFASFHEAQVTLDLCRRALSDILGSQPNAVTPATIQKAVADYYKVRLADLKSERRTRAVTRPRHVAIYLTRNLTELSLPEIGQAFGGRNHTTVLHACSRIESLVKTDENLAQEVKVLRHLVSD